MRVVVVSLNGLQELSGGGLYLRSLVQGLLDTGAVTGMTVVSKKMVGSDRPFVHEGVCEIELHKSAFLDVLARVRLQPTFLGMHQKAIFKACASADLVLFHNSRCGLIAQALKRRFPGKKVVMASDNVEADLMRQHRAAVGGFAKIYAKIEEAEILRAERQVRDLDAVTFITQADKVLFEACYGVHPVSDILPITVGSQANVRNAVPATGYVLFTGHFAFQPNIDSLQVLLQVAEAINVGKGDADRMAFVVAGAGLDKLGAPSIPGVKYHSSPSVAQMDALFRNAACYLAPVLWGSGMKTKVAEALSYGLPVVALPNAGVGYESVLNDKVGAKALEIAQNVEGLVAGLRARMLPGRLLEDRQIALHAYEKWYSSKAQAQRFNDIFRRLGVQ